MWSLSFFVNYSKASQRNLWEVFSFVIHIPMIALVDH